MRSCKFFDRFHAGSEWELTVQGFCARQEVIVWIRACSRVFSFGEKVCARGIGVDGTMAD